MISVQQSNKDNPRFVEYYQVLADLIGIFWQFHKQRIESKNIEFAYMYNAESNTHERFNPKKESEARQKEKHYRPYRVIEDFGNCVSRTLQASWDQFLNGVGIPKWDRESFINSIQPPESIKKHFSDPYIRSLVDRAGELGKELSSVSLRDDYSVKAVVNAGISTGSEVTTQLRALFGKVFNPVLAVVISKVSLKNVDDARSGIGLTEVIGGGHEGIPQYSLLNASKDFLDKDKLKMLGLGKTLGCPAGIKISKDAERFLKKCGINTSPETMLEGFASMVNEQAKPYLEEWFCNLSEMGRQQILEPETREVLEGKRIIS